MMKTVWIDRRRKNVANNWSGGHPQRSYYDYHVHVLGEGEEMSPQSLLQIFYGNDHRDSVVLARAEEHAAKIAAIGDKPLAIKKAWEEGVIHFTVTAAVGIDAATPEEAEKRFRELFNINHPSVRVRAEEG
jgi:hypothetical protein